MVDAVVVGGGLAGLACAHGLAAAGRSVTVIEAADAVGGRARTVWREGRPVDRGFQSLFRAYPETGRFLKEIGIRRRDLRPFTRGAVFHDGRTWSRFGPPPTRAPGGGVLARSDWARLVRLVGEVVAKPPEALLEMDGPEPDTETFLRVRGFSDEAIEGFWRPLFGVIMLDRSLGADPGYFRFLLSMLARGPAVIPADGLGMIAEWAAASVEQRGGVVRTGEPVAALEADPGSGGRRLAGVRTASGELVRARHVVLAAEAPAARVLLDPVDPASAARVPDAAASVTTAAFLLDLPLYRGRTIVLNSAPHDPDEGTRIDLVCQTTNVVRPEAGEGPHVLLATSVTTGTDPAAPGIEDAVARLVGRWAPGFDWARHARHVDTFVHAFAQFRPLHGVRRELPGPRTAAENLILAGDLTAHPSIEAAVASGRRAAGIVEALSP